MDLTAEYVAVARWLTGRVGLGDQAHFLQGDVCALPFPAASFDRAWILHVGMNIEDKARLFTWIGRVLKSNDLFIVYDVMLSGDPTLVSYPMPWASQAGLSFLGRVTDYRSLLPSAGFEIVAEHDLRPQGVAALRGFSATCCRTWSRGCSRRPRSSAVFGEVVATAPGPGTVLAVPGSTHRASLDVP
ncbi:class I SAM-dependent methyltransferase [Streptomyces phaeochromogenes]|uniref:class I SAM-dependent methyltransferase n=1 Tax=Streptomyces phaeochromogenes TaxID=1923 RepID=UPI003870074C|nr:class I SAM-dependent methyltransferase [Streptomyces phaeochromogenes]